MITVMFVMNSNDMVETMVNNNDNDSNISIVVVIMSLIIIGK